MPDSRPNLPCPFCAACEVKVVRDGGELFGWCQKCYHVWEIPADTAEGEPLPSGGGSGQGE